jgi:HD superfamily phosphodiesterase
MRIPFNSIIQFVANQCNKYNIDESHSLNHAMCVLNYSKRIFDTEVKITPYIYDQRHLIYTSALLHDTCDSKYTDEKNSINEIQTFLFTNKYSDSDAEVIIDIITKMSYHKIKKNGFPDLKEYTRAFHVVREADLLAGYDFNRALLYGINMMDLDFENSFHKSKKLFYERMDKHISDKLFTTKFAIDYANDFCDKEKNNILVYENLIEDKN